jgi:hypothetical protein
VWRPKVSECAAPHPLVGADVVRRTSRGSSKATARVGTLPRDSGRYDTLSRAWLGRRMTRSSSPRRAAT